MSIKLNIVNATAEETIHIELDEQDSMGDVVELASQYWNKNTDAFVMKLNNRLLASHQTAEDLGLKNGDTVILVPDPQGG